MPRYEIRDNKTGKTVVVEGNTPPTSSDAERIFQQAGLRETGGFVQKVARGAPKLLRELFSPTAFYETGKTAVKEWAIPYGKMVGEAVAQLPTLAGQPRIGMQFMSPEEQRDFTFKKGLQTTGKGLLAGATFYGPTKTAISAAGLGRQAIIPAAKTTLKGIPESLAGIGKKSLGGKVVAAGKAGLKTAALPFEMQNVLYRGVPGLGQVAGAATPFVTRTQQVMLGSKLLNARREEPKEDFISKIAKAPEGRKELPFLAEAALFPAIYGIGGGITAIGSRTTKRQAASLIKKLETYRKQVSKAASTISPEAPAGVAGKVTAGEYYGKLIKDIDESLVTLEKAMPNLPEKLAKGAKVKVPSQVAATTEALKVFSAEPKLTSADKLTTELITTMTKDKEIWRKSLAKEYAPIPPVKGATMISKEIGAVTTEAEKARRIVPRQIKTISVLRQRAGLASVHLNQIIKQAFGKESVTQLTKQEGEILKTYLQPKYTAKLAPKVEAAKVAETAVRETKATQYEVQVTRSALEDEIKGQQMLKDTEVAVKDLAEQTRATDLAPTKPATLGGKALQKLAERLPFGLDLVAVPTVAKIVGGEAYHNKVLAIIETARLAGNQLEKSMRTLGKKLGRTGYRNALIIAHKIPGGVANPTEKEIEGAKYLRSLFDAHFNLTNYVRTMAGLKPVPKRENYIPYILAEEIQSFAQLSGQFKFWKERTKTEKEFMAGLFTTDPEFMAQRFARAAEGYLRRNMYSALLKDKADKLKEGKDLMSAFVEQAETKDIGILYAPKYGFGSFEGKKMLGIVRNIRTTKVPISKEQTKALENTSLGPLFQDAIKKGYFEVPSKFFANLAEQPAGGVALKVIYTAKLGLNALFTLVNLTQNSWGLPFVGMGNTAKAAFQTIQFLSPLNPKKGQLLKEALAEGGAYSKLYGGENLPLFGFVDDVLNFNVHLSELFNRTMSGQMGLNFLKSVEKKGAVFSVKDKLKIINEFTKTIHPIGGRGRAAYFARDSDFKRAFYMFQQFPAQMLDVGSEYYRLMKNDRGLSSFWKEITQRSGASEDAIKMWDTLPAESKAKFFNIFVGVSLPVLAIWQATGSWSIALRYLPSRTLIPDFQGPVTQLVSKIPGFIDDPEAGWEDLKKEVIDTFKPAQVLRLLDARELIEKGYIESGGKPRYFEGEEYRGLPSAARVGLFGRSIISEPKEFEETAKLREEAKKSSEEKNKLAAKIAKDLKKIKAVDERKRYLAKLIQDGTLDEDILERVGEYVLEVQTERGSLERNIASMPVEQRAKYILNKIKEKSPEERKQFVLEMIKIGALTDATVDEMLLQMQEQPQKESPLDFFNFLK